MPRRITATSAKAQDASASFNQIRAAFMQRASAPNVAPFALKLAYVIAFKYMNRETQTARPAQETLARDLNVTSRTIRTLLDILEPLGLTIIPGHGPNRASSYCLDPDKISNRKPEPENRKPASAYNRKPASASKSNTGKSVHDNRKLDDSKTGSQLPPNLTKRTKVRTKKGRRLSRPLSLRWGKTSKPTTHSIAFGRSIRSTTAKRERARICTGDRRHRSGNHHHRRAALCAGRTDAARASRSDGAAHGDGAQLAARSALE